MSRQEIETTMAGVMNAASSGADLTHPHASMGWLVGATVAVFLLAIVAGIGLWAYGKVKSLAKLPGGNSGAGADVAGAGMASGSGAGWL